MKLRVKILKFLAGRPVCMIHEKKAKEMSLHVNDRVLISKNHNKIISVVDTATGILKQNEIALSEEIIENLDLKKGNFVDVTIEELPLSINLIKKKLNKHKLSEFEINEIIKDIANNALTETEVAFFISAVYTAGMDNNEIKYLIEAIVKNGKRLRLRGKVIDKHSIGGVAGNRTTPIVVSICAAAGLIMPKTSSRAITSAAGTADVIETLAKVDFSLNELKKIIHKTHACLVWGGALGLAPTDDKIIRVEKLIKIDSTAQLLASILSKKISVDSKYVLIDIPFGKSAKVSKKQAEKLKHQFITLGSMFGLKIKCILTKGDEPIGNGIGPVLEMRDVISVLKNDFPEDLRKKSVFLAGQIFELSGKSKKGKGQALAESILKSRKSWKKFLEIIKAQKGKINSKRLRLGIFKHEIEARKNMKIKHIDNKLINTLARFAGCPEDKSAGVYLYKKAGDFVKNKQIILAIYSDSEEKLRNAKHFADKYLKQMIQS